MRYQYFYLFYLNVEFNKEPILLIHTYYISSEKEKQLSIVLNCFAEFAYDVQKEKIGIFVC